MSCISPIILFNALSSVSGGQYLTATNKTRILTISYFAGAIVDLIINYFLIPKIGAVGAALGTVSAEFIIFLIQIICIKEIINIKNFINSFFKYLSCGLIMFVTSYLVGKELGNNAISTICQIVSGVIVYFSLLFMIKDKFLKEIINKWKIILKNILNRKGESNE